MKPRDCRTESDLLKMRRDNISAGDFWMISGAQGVTIAAQKVGSEPTGMVKVPHKTFARLVDFYMRDQKPRKVKRA